MPKHSQKLTSDARRIAAARMSLEVCCLKAAISLTQETNESGNYKNPVEKMKTCVNMRQGLHNLEEVGSDTKGICNSAAYYL